MPPKKVKKKPPTGVRPQSAGAPTQARRAKRKPRLIAWRWYVALSGPIVISGIVLFASWIQLFNVLQFEDYLQDQLIAHLDTQVEKSFDSDDISLILVDQQSRQEQPSGEANPNHRQYHAKLIDALSQAGAKVIALDMWFDRDSAHDADLARAITRAEAFGTAVLIGLNPEAQGNQYIPVALRGIAEDRWGIIAGGGGGNSKLVSRVKLAEEDGKSSKIEPVERPVVPSLVLRSVQHLKFQNSPVGFFFNPLQGQLQMRDGNGQLLRSIPVNRKFYFLVDLVGSHEEGEITYYHDVYSQIQQGHSDYFTRFKNKIVLVGYQTGDVVPTRDGNRFGTEVIANAISNILLQSYIKPLGFTPHYFLILLMAVIGALLPLRFAKWLTFTFPVKLPIVGNLPIPVALLAVMLVYIFVAMLAYKFE